MSLTLGLVLTSALLASGGQPVGALVQDVDAFQQRLNKIAIASKKPYDPLTLRARVAEYARGKTAAINLDTVVPKDAPALAKLLIRAERFADARRVAEAALPATRDEGQRLTLLEQVFDAALREGAGTEVVARLAEVRGSTPTSILKAAGLVADYAAYVEGDGAPEAGLAAVAANEADLAKVTTNLKLRKELQDRLKATRVEILTYARRDEEARSAAARALPTLGERPAGRVRALLTQLDLRGKTLPEPKYDRAYGSFPGFAALKGKVVLVELFAHWCAPCRRTLPILSRLQSELGSKGLELVGITAYFGYYGSEKDLKPEAEYARFAAFREAFRITWPVVFLENRKAFAPYGDAGIPHLILLDREGKVRHIEAGDSPRQYEALRSRIVDLLGPS